MLAAVSVAVLVVALGAWSSGNGAGAAVAVHQRPQRLRPLRLAPAPSVSTTCYVGASPGCSLTPCVRFVGSGGLQRPVLAQLQSRSRPALPKALLRALSQAQSPPPPAVPRALSQLSQPSPQGSRCRRMGQAPERVTDMLLGQRSSEVSLAQQSPMITQLKRRGPALTR